LMIVVLAMDAFTGATLGAVVLPLNLICTIIGVSNLFVTIAIYVVGLVFAFFFGREFLRAKKRSWFVFVIVYAMALIYYAAVLIFSILEITSLGDLGLVMMINIIVYVVPLTFDALILFYLTRPKVRAFFSVGNVAAANPAAPQQAMYQTGYYQPQSPYGYQAPQGQRYAPVPGAQRNMNAQGVPMRQRPPQQPRPQPAAPANPEKTVKYPGGEIFTGKVYNGMPSSGKMQYSNGVVYTGDFDSNGKYSGHGIIEWPNGDSFEGDFVNGVYSGYGRYDSADGSWTKGRYEDGKLNGTATVFVSSNEYTYEGVAENGVFTGEVSIEHDGVCVYEGLVSGYKPSGKGTMYVSGGRIEGMWTGFDYVQGRFYGTDGIVMDVVLGKDDFTGPYERL